MGVIVNIIGPNIKNVKFDGVAIENGFEITKNGTLTFECGNVPVYVNDTRLLGTNETSNTLDLDVSSLSEITINNESMGFIAETDSFTVNITGIQTAITQLAPFLTTIANAIRTKKGTTATIKARNFASEIESIESVGGLTGYSTNDTIYNSTTFILGILEDGTITQTHSAANKYVFLIFQYGNVMSAYTNCIVYELGSFRENYLFGYAVKPTADNWSFTWQAGSGA